ncbi:pyrroline-5-carboxylate reductase [Enterococcus sp. AZ103]|uniref:pyrroline-5-carboxylate reductase n=1 Tax=Enterococcus sp. AZ103 TaxID=2774628 RepID=UPI003F264667
MKIGFIGAGNMARAIIEGIISQKFVSAEDVYLYNIHFEKAQNLADQLGIHAVEEVNQLVEAVDTVVLAVKPPIIESVVNEIRTTILAKNSLIVSIAAGKDLATLYDYLETEQAVSIIRVMPNMNSMVGQGATAVCGNQFTSKEQVAEIIALFAAIGKAWELPEEQFSTFAAIAGSSPAFTFLYIDSLARAGVKNGLPKDLATEMATQAVLGSAETLAASSENAWGLIDQVSSPGGTTVAGVVSLEDNRFLATVVKAVDDTIAREKEL